MPSNNFSTVPLKINLYAQWLSEYGCNRDRYIEVECKQWQSSTKLVSIGTSIHSKISKTFDSRPLSATLAGIAEISRYSLLEYCSSAQYLLSTVTSTSDSLVFTFIATYILVPRV